jgi:hypothetical protein
MSVDRCLEEEDELDYDETSTATGDDMSRSESAQAFLTTTSNTDQQWQSLLDELQTMLIDQPAASSPAPTSPAPTSSHSSNVPPAASAQLRKSTSSGNAVKFEFDDASIRKCNKEDLIKMLIKEELEVPEGWSRARMFVHKRFPPNEHKKKVMKSMYDVETPEEIEKQRIERMKAAEAALKKAQKNKGDDGGGKKLDVNKREGIMFDIHHRQFEYKKKEREKKEQLEKEQDSEEQRAARLAAEAAAMKAAQDKKYTRGTGAQEQTDSNQTGFKLGKGGQKSGAQMGDADKLRNQKVTLFSLSNACGRFWCAENCVMVPVLEPN